MQSYYYVYNPNRQPPNNRHKTFEEAKIEAERLSLKHGCEIQILKCVAMSNVSAVSTILTEDEESKREPQYRMLEVGDQIKTGDEYYNSLQGWISADQYAGLKIHDWHCKHRRPITPNNQ